MSMGILGKKLGMTRIFDENGASVPVTVVEAGPCPIVSVKIPDRDGYSALQLGFDEKKEHRVNKPEKGHFGKAGVPVTKHLREMRLDDVSGYEAGQVVNADIFEEGDVVHVSGTSKGKGFAGVMKRHNFSGGPDSHGASKVHRKVGSIGAGSYPAHIFKGQKMPGQMGDEKVTVKNLVVKKVDGENNLLLIKGSVPGARNGLVVIHKSEKQGGRD
ncbi:MAG: 50S ribosomal protein L3 [Synergistales bacterium]|nr:50S ribosomal protein L3 [Synergistales bacterium]